MFVTVSVMVLRWIASSKYIDSVGMSDGKVMMMLGWEGEGVTSSMVAGLECWCWPVVGWFEGGCCLGLSVCKAASLLPLAEDGCCEQTLATAHSGHSCEWTPIPRGHHITSPNSIIMSLLDSAVGIT